MLSPEYTIIFPVDGPKAKSTLLAFLSAYFDCITGWKKFIRNLE